MEQSAQEATGVVVALVSARGLRALGALTVLIAPFLSSMEHGAHFSQKAA